MSRLGTGTQREHVCLRKNLGFTIPEVLVVCSVLLVMFGVLIGVYSQARYLLARGSAKIEMHQKLRQASSRVIPYIASAVRRADDPARGVVFDPDPLPEDHPFGLGGTHCLEAVVHPRPNDEDNVYTSDHLILRSTQSYVDKILRKEVITPFEPRDPFGIANPDLDGLTNLEVASLGMYRIFLDDMPGEDQSDPELRRRMLVLDENTPGDDTDDIPLALGIHNATFTQDFSNVVTVEIEVRRYLPRPAGGLSDVPTSVTKTTRVFLPLNTNAP